MTAISLHQTRTIIAAALAKGQDMGLKPLSILVRDAGGFPVAFERQDGASIGRFAIAMGKASGLCNLAYQAARSARWRRTA
jgi:uncharacterized protein GlcG (DUF336 family)